MATHPRLPRHGGASWGPRPADRAAQRLMRPIYLARFGSKTRPVLVLTRAGQTIGLASEVTVVGITSTVHGLRSEVPVGPENGLNHSSVVNVADIQTIR